MTAPTPGPDAVARDEVGEAAAKVIERLDWSVTGDAEFDPSSREIADAVLASGLVVPVGEVAGLRRDLAIMRRDLGDLLDVADRLSDAETERDRAAAQVAAVRALAEAAVRLEAQGGPLPAMVGAHAIRAALDTAPASPATDQRIEARQLSGEHVGREVVLPDGWGGVINDVRHHGRVHGFRVDIGLRKVTLDGVPFHGDQHTNTAPSDVVTLIGGEERWPASS